MDISNLIILVTEQAEHAAEDSGGVIGTLGLNWKLFVAQLINFSVILFILWRWVFRPVGGALEARRKKIEESVAKAERIEKQMQEADLIREEKLRQARIEAEAIITRTGTEAEKSKQQALLAARDEAEKILDKAVRAIDAEKQQMLKEIRVEVADLVVMATEKILKEKIDPKKDESLIKDVLSSIH